MNFEVSPEQIASWANDLELPAERLLLINLRGQSNPFRTRVGRKQLAAQLKGLDVRVLIIDPFARAFTGSDENSSREVAHFLNTLDGFASDSGISELIVTAHAGWSNPRARGSSALEDWPDSIVYLDDKDSGARHLRAIGRDVDVPEGILEHDASTRRLTFVNSDVVRHSRGVSSVVRMLNAILDIVNAKPGSSFSAIDAKLRIQGLRVSNGATSARIDGLVKKGLVELKTGRGKARLVYPTALGKTYRFTLES
jgi:hypothetical protein